MRVALLDTGPVVAYLRQGEPAHAASVDAVEQTARRGHVVATIWEVVAEAYTLIRRRSADHRHAVEVLNWAGAVDRLPVEDVDRPGTKELLVRHRSLRLSYVDGLLLAVAERRRVDQLVTLDHELAAVRLAHPCLVRVVP